MKKYNIEKLKKLERCRNMKLEVVILVDVDDISNEFLILQSSKKENLLQMIIRNWLRNRITLEFLGT